ncbi:MAG: type 1 glutamine amidotransferase [Desulfobacteria bacterium]
MTKQFLVLQHMPWEGPGTHLIRSAEKNLVRLDIVEVWHETIPEILPYDGLIVLGGGPDVDQEKEYPFLKNEKRCIRRALEADKPYLGFCLGHQLLADALGAKTGPNFCRSIGFVAGHVTKYGRGHPMFRSIAKPFPLFKWHAQTVLPPLPKEMEVLVTSAECQVEAISVEGRPHICGLQFDNHAAVVSDMKDWTKGDEKWLQEPPPVDIEALMKDARKHETSMGEQFELMFANYIKLIS